MVDRRGRARSFRRVASLGAEIETAGSAAVKNIIMIDRPYASRGLRSWAGLRRQGRKLHIVHFNNLY